MLFNVTNEDGTKEVVSIEQRYGDYVISLAHRGKIDEANELLGKHGKVKEAFNIDFS
jgi:hypothetical protein